MRYASNSELPARVRNVLPPDAQDIYRVAFNDAYERYGSKGEALAHRIAWSTVKRHYVERSAGMWEAREPRV